MKKTIITVTGASGSGKDSLVDALLYLNGNKPFNELNNTAKAFQSVVSKQCVPIRELVSHTTRSPRRGEKEGIDYYYIDMNTFESIEKVEKVEYAGNHYCLASSELEKIQENGYGIVVVDKNGVKCIKDYVDKHTDEYDLIRVFLLLDEETSKNRMLSRGDKAEDVEKRLKQHNERHEYQANIDDFEFILPSYMLSDFFVNALKLNESLQARVTNREEGVH